MAHDFLSDEWLDAVESLDAAHSEARDGVVNLVVTGGPFGEREGNLSAGRVGRGLVADATATLTLPYDVARALLVDQDPAAGMAAFAAGRIRVEGDMTRLLDLQVASAHPTDEQRTFQERLQALTT